MKVLSLFDGLGGARIALERIGIAPNKYYASEVDKYAIQVSSKNYPDIIQVGDVKKVKGADYKGVDLLVAGSPCQGFSNAGQKLNFEDPRSKLFFEFVRILKESEPKHFLLENVRMKKEFSDVITEYLGVEPVLIDSALFSAQSRKRLYWTNIKLPEKIESNVDIKLSDIILCDSDPIILHNLYGGFKEKSVRVFTDKSPTIRTSTGGGHIPSVVKKDLLLSGKAIEYMNRKVSDGRTHWDFKHHSDIRDEKSQTIVANFFKGVPYNVFKDWDCIRKLHPIECERLQTLPDDYTGGVSNTQRYKMIGNGFTIDVIAYILSHAEFLKTD